MKYVITGSNGFIGSILTEKLQQPGSEVRCLVRAGSRRHDSERQHSEHAPIKFGIDYSSVDSLIESGALDDVDYVFHVAGVTKSLNLEGFRQGNVLPTKNLVQALLKLGTPLKRFVLISSQAAAGPARSEQAPIAESNAPTPAEDYGLSKLEAENLFRESNLPFPYTIIRPSAVYGPRDVDFLALFKQLKRGLGIYPGNRDSYLSVIHVHDLVEGIIQASSHDKAIDQTYFLTKEVSLAWHHIYRMISEIWGSQLLELNLPFGLMSLAGKFGDLYSKTTGQITMLNSKKIELSKPKYWVCTAEKAQYDFGFGPEIEIERGLQSTFEWYKEAGWL